jgi:hypothetical protein
MNRIQVEDVHAAVELAFRLRNEGHYDWFRGQTLERAPYPSLLRLQLRDDAPAIERNRRRIRMFYRWAAEVEQLAALREPQNVNQLFAVLQHYGISTHYLDFTTDPGVAGFFACDSRAPPTDGLSCIYCLNCQDLTVTWAKVSQFEARRTARIEQVVVDVRNLWRLQAQAGVFLYVNYNWDVDYRMDRIVFPYTGYPTTPTKDRIYPAQRSALEQVLDHYFDIERGAFFREERLRPMIDRLRKEGRGFVGVANSPERGIYAEAFFDAASVMERLRL